jgi:nitrogen regulatory protein PII
MKQVVATVKPFRAQAVLEAVGEFSIDTVLVAEVKGYGRQKDQLPLYHGSEFDPVYLPKIQITVLVPDDLVEPMLARIVHVARTGRIGDGKIFAFTPIAEFDL